MGGVWWGGKDVNEEGEGGMKRWRRGWYIVFMEECSSNVWFTIMNDNTIHR